MLLYAGLFLLPVGVGAQVDPDGGCRVDCGASGRPSEVSVDAAPPAATSPLAKGVLDSWIGDARTGEGWGDGGSTGAMALTRNSGDVAMANTRKKRRLGSEDVTVRPRHDQGAAMAASFVHCGKFKGRRYWWDTLEPVYPVFEVKNWMSPVFLKKAS